MSNFISFHMPLIEKKESTATPVDLDNLPVETLPGEAAQRVTYIPQTNVVGGIELAPGQTINDMEGVSATAYGWAVSAVAGDHTAENDVSDMEGIKPFRDREERDEMNRDPRYKTSPDFRRRYAKRLSISPF